jgi:hypothetical protein
VYKNERILTMTTFVNAVLNQEARTENFMKARKSTANPCVDLFFKIGASRGKDVVPAFAAAMAEDRDIALRIAQWVRDIRGGAGERQIFRDLLKYLEKNDRDAVLKLIPKTPELGRWDDLFALETSEVRQAAFALMSEALASGNGLCAKWMPRKGPNAEELRQFLGVSPKYYRKLLVELTRVVETQMCAKDWDNINFSHVPSVAAARYKKAFFRHTPKYAEYVAELMKPQEERAVGVKVNSGAVYPYDVLKGKISPYGVMYGSTENNLIQAQWEALPNYMGDVSVLPLVDVSGSMTSPVSKSGLTAIEVAVSLGLYCADKNKGKFKDTFLTFSAVPQLLNLKGNILQKIDQMVKSKWEMNTNLHAALDKILQTAVQGRVPQEEMPEMLLILSDMQFDHCVRHDDSAIEMIDRKYTEAGYKMPKVTFWNINSYDNVPVKFDANGTALVSGFSPSILKSVLAADMEAFSPYQIMLKTLLVDRYNLE